MSVINQMLKDLEQRRGQASPVARLVESLGVRTESLPTGNKTVWRLLFPVSAVLLAASFLLIKSHHPDSGIAVTPAATASDRPASRPLKQPAMHGGVAADQQSVDPDKAPEPLVDAAQPMQSTELVSMQPHASAVESSAASVDAVAASRAAPATAPTVAARGDSLPEASRKVSTRKAAVAPAIAEEEPRVATTPVNDIKRPAGTALRAESHYQRALDYLQVSRIDPAITELREAVRLQADMHVARELLANLYLRSGREAEAFMVLKAGIDASPQYLPFAKMYARILVERGQLSAAKQVLESSLLYAGNDADYQALLAAVEQRLGEHAEAVSRYMHALDLNKQQGAWWVGMGISLEALGRTTEAGQAYRAARIIPGLSAELVTYVDARLKQLGARS